MIGRAGPVKPFELIRWARAQAREHELTQLEAHVLLLLATYADKEAVAWPSVATLARDSCLKVSVRVRDGRREESNSSVSAALVRLEELQLIWRKQGGRGRPAKTELLFNPATWQPTDTQEGNGRSSPPVTRRAADANTHRPTGGQGETEPTGTPEGKREEAGMSSPPANEALALRQAGGELPVVNGQKGLTAKRPDDALRQAGGHPTEGSLRRMRFDVPDVPGAPEEAA